MNMNKYAKMFLQREIPYGKKRMEVYIYYYVKDRNSSNGKNVKHFCNVLKDVFSLYYSFKNIHILTIGKNPSYEIRIDLSFEETFDVYDYESILGQIDDVINKLSSTLPYICGVEVEINTIDIIYK